jgi:hypothetical protein
MSVLERASEPTARTVRHSWVDTLAVALALLTFLAYAVRAAALISYPWDWSPDDGLALDHARRLAHAPSTLFVHDVVPFPPVYGVALPTLLLPAVLLPFPALLVARCIAALWTAVIAVASYRLIRRSAPATMAVAGAALVLAPVDLTFWYMLLRSDGPMVALWLLAALLLLPSRLERGADRLCRRRLLLGNALLLAAVLAKPSAALLGAPLILGWFLVDVRSAWRAAAVIVAFGLSALAAFQLATGGEFLWVILLWRDHPAFREVFVRNIQIFVEHGWPLLAVAAASVVLARGSGTRVGRDSSLLLVLGGALIIPMLAKFGSLWTYLLPLLCACGIAAARLWPQEHPLGIWPPPSWRRAGTPFVAAAALGLAATREFPLPTREDAAAAASFYGFVDQYLREHPGRVLATRPEYVYFRAGQPAEIEATSFHILVRDRAPGIERVRERLEAHEYTLIVFDPTYFPREGGYLDAVVRNYRAAGNCVLTLVDGATRFHLLVPKAVLPISVPQFASSRCVADAGVASTVP